MATNPVYLTKERVQELDGELKQLKGKGRAEIAQAIAEARSHGDLSENGDYDAAKEAQGLMELRISKIEAILSRARVIEANEFPNDKIYILSKVKVRNKKNNIISDYLLVSDEEADFERNKLSITSLIGKALMGKVVGDSISVKVPAGLMEYEILAIDR